MAYEVVMPKAGMAMEFGTIIKWLKNVGDKVEYGEPLLEIETDKTSMQVEAMNDGYLMSKLYDEGDEVPVVTTIGYIGQLGEKLPEGNDNVHDSKNLKEKESCDNCVDDRSESAKNEYDVVVVGGGPAGYISAIACARRGMHVAIVEKDSLGGTCLNRGCIPTKTYLKTAELIHGIYNVGQRGINIHEPSFDIDMKTVVAEKEKVVAQLVNGIKGLMRSNGIDVYSGEGKIYSDKTVRVNDDTILSADNVIFAGGSQASVIPIPGIDHKAVMLSDGILELTSLPESLVVIGGGVIGVEMASAFNAFGSKVTVIEMMDRLVPAVDAEISECLKKELTAQGIDIMTGIKIEKIEDHDGKAVICTDSGKKIESDKVLLSIGRKPDLSGLGNVDVNIDSQGRVLVDDHMRTNISWLYAPGDINGRVMLAHAAFSMAEVAAANCAGEEVRFKDAYVPSCIYTILEIGCIGKKEEELEHSDISIGRFAFGNNGRALASGEGKGFVKVITDKKTGEIYGVHIIGPNATEIINEASALMTMEITAYEVPSIVHGHPTYSEALMEAISDSVGASYHSPPKKKS